MIFIYFQRNSFPSSAKIWFEFNPGIGIWVYQKSKFANKEILVELPFCISRLILEPVVTSKPSLMVSMGF
jgi:hypothetical protein